jgi:hypothetical protein
VAYLGNDLQVAFPTYRNIDDISGSFNGVTTSFPLTVDGVAPIPAPVNSQQCLISVNGVVQRPDDSGAEGFLLSGGNIVFASAPAGGVDFFGVILAGADYINIGANFPSGTALVPSITFDSDLDTGIYNPAGNQIGFTTAGVQRLVINSSGQVSGGLGSATTPAFSFLSDPNTGIYSPGADQVAVATNGTGRLFVDASGNIKVSTGEIFQTSADGYIRLDGGTGSGTGANVLVFGESHGAAPGRVAITAVGTGAILASTGGAERLRITSAGLVGIGTTSPGTKLEVAGSAAFRTDADVRLTLGSSGSIGSNDSNFIRAATDQVIYNAATSSGRHSWELAGSEKARIDSSGRLGIGTSSPQAVLESKTASVQPGDAAYAKKSVVANIPYSTSNITSSALAVYDGTIHAADIGYSYDGSGYYLTLGTSLNTISAPTERVRIDRLGNVGIGTTSPSSLLELSGVSNPQITLDGTTTSGYRGLIFAYDGTGFGQIGQNVQSGELIIRSGESGQTGYFINFSVNGSDAARIDSSGRLGIGTSSPGTKLEVFNTGTYGTAFQPSIYITNASIGGTVSANTGLGAITWATDSNANLVSSIEAIRENPGLGTASALVLRTGSSGGGTERLRITSAGNVGIGTTSPISKLHVSNSGAEGFEFTPGSATNANLTTHYNRNGSFVYVANQVSAANHQFFVGASEAARIDSSGRLLVGTSSTANRGAAKHIVQGDASFGDGLGKVHTIYKETTDLADAATFDVDLISLTGTCCGFGTVFYSVGTNQQVQTFSFAGRQSGAVVQLQDAIARDSGVSGVTVTFASVTSAGKIRITNGSGSILGQVQVTLFLHSTLS